MNDRIRAREVRLVDPDGNQLGIKLLPEALTIARQMDLDLVEVAPLASPPVCRIMDYGKFKFDEAQRAKESRRKATNVGIKEMKYRPKIGQGDFDTKTRQVARFLGEGHKVKITIMFRGREVFHPELGKRILDKIAEAVDGSAKVESEARLDGRNMVMVLAPDKRARQSNAAKTHGDEAATAAAAAAAPAVAAAASAPAAAPAAAAAPAVAAAAATATAAAAPGETAGAPSEPSTPTAPTARSSAQAPSKATAPTDAASAPAPTAKTPNKEKG